MENAPRLMRVRIGDHVMLPDYAPYPRFGQARQQDSDHIRVGQVYCGDPRCVAEHQHSDEIWPLANVRAARAYQARADWEQGRKSSPNAPLE